MGERSRCGFPKAKQSERPRYRRSYSKSAVLYPKPSDESGRGAVEARGDYAGAVPRAKQRYPNRLPRCERTRTVNTTPVRDHLLGERREWVQTAIDCADAVASGWDGGRTTDSERVVSPYRTTLDRAGVLADAPAVLRECVEAAGEQLSADPVAAPPYVVVTSEGLLLRATLGERLLVRIRVFGLADGTYERVNETPAEAVAIELV